MTDLTRPDWGRLADIELSGNGVGTWLWSDGKALYSRWRVVDEELLLGCSDSESLKAFSPTIEIGADRVLLEKTSYRVKIEEESRILITAPWAGARTTVLTRIPE